MNNSYIDEYNRREALAEALASGTKSGATQAYEQALQKAQDIQAGYNDEADKAKTALDIVAGPLIHEGVAGAVNRLKETAITKAEKVGKDLVNRARVEGNSRLEAFASKYGISKEDLGAYLNDNKSKSLSEIGKGLKGLVTKQMPDLATQSGEEALKDLSPLGKLKSSVRDGVKFGQQSLKDMQTKARTIVKSKEQDFQQMAKRAQKSQQKIRQQAQQLESKATRAELDAKQEQALNRMRALTSQPKIEASKLDPTDPDFLQQSRMQMPSADNDSRLAFLEENSPRDFEEATNPFRLRSVLGEDAQSALSGYQAEQRGAYEPLKQFKQRVANRTRLLKQGKIAEASVESENTPLIEDSLKPMRELSARFDINRGATDIVKMGNDRFNSIKSRLLSSMGQPSPEQVQEQQLKVVENQQQAQPKPTADAQPEEAPHTNTGNIGENALPTENSTLGATPKPPTQDLSTDGTDAKIGVDTSEGGKTSLVDDFGKALVTGAETDAEMGGPSDVYGDVVAGITGIASLLGSIFTEPKKEQPPPEPAPTQMLNPASQAGV
jgi:hypothetical protein